ncbi:acyltransferase family protein [Pseudomonas sp. F3-2]|uniref:acyltransferase family protein n=1 Tax=Pseudomonas sp. F3-2 TaxID=3141539 RepID=UPI00315D7586
MHTFGNRRDIDGLRALAVIPVVLFHFGLGFSGGFVGVDVFFVISGYLITSIIFREISAGRFSFVDFWARRARRILPALSVVLLACLVVGWLLLTPKDLSQLGRAVRYQATFMSNILFMRQDGYFNPASDFKPLLHTWSLSVEEQYYVFFPMLMVLLTRFLKHWRMVLGGLLLLSFGLNVWIINRNPDAAFFLLPMRAWELLCGAMLAVVPATSTRLRPWVYEAVSGLGLLLVLYAMFALDKFTPFPGKAALLPVLGAAAMIWANGHRSTLVGRVLSHPALVSVGLISYSLYLWHWPVFVYANAISVDAMVWSESVLWIALSVVLALLSWKFVELPFRDRRVLATRKSILVGGLAAIVVLGTAGQVIRSADGVPGRLSGLAKAYADSREWQAGQLQCLMDSDSKEPMKVCRFGPESHDTPEQLVWGDSHAAHLLPAIKSDAELYNQPVWLISLSGCPPIPGKVSRKQCADFNKRVASLIQEKRIHDVVLAARWSLYLYGAEDGDMRNAIYKRESREVAEQRVSAQIRETVASIRQTGAQVWLVKEVPLQRQGTIARLSSLAMVGRSAADVGRPITDHLARQRFISELFASLSAADPDVHVLDPAPILCPDGICRAALNGVSQYKDEDHLSDHGGERMKPLLAPVFLGENTLRGG